MKEIASGIWLAEGKAGWGHSNAVLVAGEGDGLIFDCQFTAAHGRAILEDARHILAADPTHLVYSHANPDHTWGSAAIPDAEVLASRATADEMPAETSVAVLRHLLALPDPAPGSAPSYVQRHFGCFDFTDLPEPRRPTRTFHDRLELTVGGRDTELLRLGPAHTAGDTVAHVPSARVALTGDIVFIDDHAVSWGAPLTGWVAALDAVLALPVDRYVPGHGPVVGRTQVAGVRDQLAEVVDFGRRSLAAGRPLLAAAREYDARARYGWGLPERVVTLLAAVYRQEGAGAGDEAQLGVVDLIAAHHADITARPAPAPPD